MYGEVEVQLHIFLTPKHLMEVTALVLAEHGGKEENPSSPFSDLIPCHVANRLVTVLTEVSRFTKSGLSYKNLIFDIKYTVH